MRASHKHDSDRSGSDRYGSSWLGPGLRTVLMDLSIDSIAAPTLFREIGGGESQAKWLGASHGRLVSRGSASDRGPVVDRCAAV
jgi:hypothetical protein